MWGYTYIKRLTDFSHWMSRVSVVRIYCTISSYIPTTPTNGVCYEVLTRVFTALFSRIFNRSLNAPIESRENWAWAQNGKLDEVKSGEGGMGGCTLLLPPHHQSIMLRGRFARFFFRVRWIIDDLWTVQVKTNLKINCGVTKNCNLEF